MTGEQGVCAHCSAIVLRADRFCESCGAPLAEIRRVVIPRRGQDPTGPERPCADCGNATFSDDYCSVCGHRRTEPDRDEVVLGGVTLITDRGIQHAGNEDAAAAGVVVGGGDRPDAIAVVVCDGVSSTSDAHAAAAAASAAGVDAMLAALAEVRPARAVVLAGLSGAAKAAAAAQTDPSYAPSCTYTGAIIVPNSEGAVQITVGNVGDSRAYWLPSQAPAQQLTVDDSLAQELITAGAAADSEAVQRGAHTLTRWLGADGGSTPWSETSVTTTTVTGPGSLLLCSDGLWNYLPDAEDIARRCTGTDAIETVRSLVEFALLSGGHDNITVALIPIGGIHEFS